jgi:putative hydroxymethylpyrimidine transport system permease protein
LKIKYFRGIIIAAGLVLLWQLIVLLSGAPCYILPGPLPVARAIVSHFPLLMGHLQTTFLEIIMGLVLGMLLGISCALAMTVLPRLKSWMLPVLVVSQAIPVFALAPVLVLWLGYGLASKVAMTVLIIFFPVCSSFYYGMQRLDADLLELARIMHGRRTAILRHIIIPAALPSFASGVRVAAAVAPIGAIVGEWVGSSSGLGFYMLHTNARMQIDLMFAALTVLSVCSLILYFLIDYSLNRLVFWETTREMHHAVHK